MKTIGRILVASFEAVVVGVIVGCYAVYFITCDEVKKVLAARETKRLL